MTRRTCSKWRAVARDDAIAVWFGLLLSQLASADTVERRGSEPKLEGEVKQIDDAGVLIVSRTGAEHLVTWDRVRSVEKDPPDPKVEQLRERATNLWRARSRLERGDAALAELLFERLFPDYRGKTHETALIVAEGLLRCRLARGANEGAVIPALEVARLRHKGVRTIAYSSLPPVFDDATLLSPVLPPVWAGTSGLATLERDLQAYDDSVGDPPVSAIAAWYRAAVRRQLGLPEEPPSKLATDHVGVSLLQALVDTGAGESKAREAARAAIERRMPELPTWAQAWARFALGRSLLMESGVGRQQAGMVDLAYLPASFRQEQPYLCAVALQTMAEALERTGDVEGAAAMRAELTQLFPDPISDARTATTKESP